MASCGIIYCDEVFLYVLIPAGEQRITKTGEQRGSPINTTELTSPKSPEWGGFPVLIQKQFVDGEELIC